MPSEPLLDVSALALNGEKDFLIDQTSMKLRLCANNLPNLTF
jgi:hypothetical protein